MLLSGSIARPFVTGAASAAEDAKIALAPRTTEMTILFFMTQLLRVCVVSTWGIAECSGLLIGEASPVRRPQRAPFTRAGMVSFSERSAGLPIVSVCQFLPDSAHPNPASASAGEPRLGSSATAHSNSGTLRALSPVARWPPTCVPGALSRDRGRRLPPITSGGPTWGFTSPVPFVTALDAAQRTRDQLIASGLK